MKYFEFGKERLERMVMLYGSGGISGAVFAERAERCV